MELDLARPMGYETLPKAPEEFGRTRRKPSYRHFMMVLSAGPSLVITGHRLRAFHSWDKPPRSNDLLSGFFPNEP